MSGVDVAPTLEVTMAMNGVITNVLIRTSRGDLVDITRLCKSVQVRTECGHTVYEAQLLHIAFGERKKGGAA